MSGYRSACFLMLALAPGWAAAEATTYPFEGRWDCGGSTFSFTATTYNNGLGQQTIVGVEAEGTGFVLTLANDQDVVVSELTEGTMVWLLWSTGEQRNCTRLD
jgi:hypothetical protein